MTKEETNMQEIPVQMFIDGKWCDASDNKTIDLINPATEETLGKIPSATREDVLRALQAADKGLKVWRETDVWTRSRMIRDVADIIKKNSEIFARALTEEQGKPINEARGEVVAAAEQFDWYADEARRIYGRTVDGHSTENRILVIRQPIGVVAAFSPWNFPVLLTARKMAPALAAGCPVVVKPAREAPRSAFLLAKACESAGMPAGVVNFVTGSSEMIARTLIKSPSVRKVTVTGSVPVGQQIMSLCAEELKVCTMELGGHSPVLVFPDADPVDAAETCARAKYRNNGQVCISASRFYVHESIIDVFTEKFVEVARSLKLGNGMDDGTELGPLANKRRLDVTRELIDDAVEKGAKLAYGGKRPGGFDKGFFMEPAVLTDVTPEMRIMYEEPFCPVAPIMSFSDIDDAVSKANSTEFGLAAYIFTNDLKTSFVASEKIEAGMVGVNHMLLATAEAPFGGVKKSGFGREGGSEGITDYLITKYINIKL